MKLYLKFIKVVFELFNDCFYIKGLGLGFNFFEHNFSNKMSKKFSMGK